MEKSRIQAQSTVLHDEAERDGLDWPLVKHKHTLSLSHLIPASS